MPHQNSYIDGLYTILTNNNLTKIEQHQQALQIIDLMIAEPKEFNNPESCFDITNEQGITALWIAINTRHNDLVQELLARGANPNLGERTKGITLLQLAAKKNNLPVIMMLIAAGANPNWVSTDWSPLAYAIANDNLDMVTLLLKAKAGPNTLEPSGELPLNLAKSSKVRNFLLRAKPYSAEVNAYNAAGDTALIHAVRQGNLSAISNLLQANALPNLKNTMTDETPLSIAINDNEATIVEALLLGGAKTDTAELHNQLFFWAIEKGHEKVVKILLSKGANPNVITQNNTTPLRSAYEHNQSHIMTLLLQHGAKVQNAALDKALFLHAVERNALNTIRLLLAQGSRPNSIQGNQMPLFIALERNNNELVDLLLNTKVNPNQPHPETGITPLLQAAMRNNFKAVQSLLAAGAYPDFTQNEKDTPLNWAAFRGNLRMVQALVDAGAQSHSPDENGYTPLLNAVEKNCEIVDVLLNAKHYPANPNQANLLNGETPLLAAIRIGGAKSVESLLRAHANPNLPNEKTGLTPLMSAVNFNDYPITELLLTQGAQVTNETERTTIYKWAIVNGHLNVLRSMLAFGAEVDLIPQEKKTPLQLALDNNKPQIIEALLIKGAQLDNEQIKADLFSWAVIGGHIAIVKLLLARQIHPDLILNEKKTALQLAVEYNQMELMQLLLAAKANPDSINPSTGASLLSDAAYRKNLKAVKLLLSANAKPNITEAGRGALGWAAYYNQFSMLTLLLSEGVNPNSQNRGDTPLILAIEHGSSKLVSALLNAYPNSADPNCPHPTTGFTSLMYALEANDPEKVQLLLSAQANPNQINDRTGHTVLSVCAQLERVEFAELLLQKGAKPSEQDLKGKFFIWAISRGYCNILKQLLAEGSDPNLAMPKDESPLFIAQINNQAEAAELLMLAGANLKQKYVNCSTLMFLAAEKNCLESIELLLKAEIPLDAFNPEGKTLLTIAAEGGYVKLADVLLDAGASPNLATKYSKKTPFELACLKGCTEIARLLLNKNGKSSDVDGVLTREMHQLLSHSIKTENSSMILLFLQYQLVDDFKPVYRFISRQPQSNPDVANSLQIILASKSLAFNMLDETKLINYGASLKKLESTYDTLLANNIRKAMPVPMPSEVCLLIQTYQGSFFKPTAKPIQFADLQSVDHHLKQLNSDIAAEQKLESDDTGNVATKFLSGMKNWFR